MTKIMNKDIQRIPHEILPLPSIALYMTWGEEKIRQMVRYHHYLLHLSEIDNFFSSDQAQFDHATAKTADYFVDVLSRGKFSNVTYPYPALKLRYFQIIIDEHVRDVWLDAFKKTIIDMKMPSECIEDFWNWIETLSLWMVNRRTMPKIPRYPYREIWTDFVDFKQMNRCG